MTIREQLIKEIERTPDDNLWEQVLDFALFLRAKNGETVVNQEKLLFNNDAFLKGYAPEDEGLYDDYPTR
jgi:hypothetical protein